MQIKKAVLLTLLAAQPFIVSAQNQNEKLLPSTSKALPDGMKMAWHDEFNSTNLDSSLWWNRYFSSLDWMNSDAVEAFRANQLPVADYEMTGSSIILVANDKIYPGANRQISSIQSYNWQRNENSTSMVGGFFEARIRRDYAPTADRINLAFWFDSPGPDLKYYLEQGTEVLKSKGIRPRGQVFEIDLCEYITTELVLHGNVDSDGKFERNIGHHIHKGDFKGQWVTHSMLWTPAGLKFYIDGELIKEWWNPKEIKSPNHAMNLFLGAYGINGVTMEADYVRIYQWELEEGNWLPNPGFDYGEKAFPWEGSGIIVTSKTHNENRMLQLLPGQHMSQMIYLDHSKNYKLTFQSEGSGALEAKIENIEQVTGKAVKSEKTSIKPTQKPTSNNLKFSTIPEPEENKRTVRLIFENRGASPIYIDKVQIEQNE